MATLSVWSNGNFKEISFDAPQPLHVLLEAAGFYGLRPCGGLGKCGKCAVTLCGEVSEPNAAEVSAGLRLACQAEVLGDAQVFLPTAADLQQIQTDSEADTSVVTPSEGIGIAVDIGSTTLVLRRYDLQTGALVGQSAMINPQTSIAADVMGRIGSAMDGKGKLLQTQILDALALLLHQAGGSADKAVITGNTTMLYLLTGRDPSSLSCAPFQADDLFGREATVLEIPAYLPPCMNAFVGADISCAVLASGMCKEKTALLCDIGTNGEIALWKDGVLSVTSTAAGPAFEGAGLSMGMSGRSGAIDRVQIVNGELFAHVIGEGAPQGICGSGVIDGVACLLDLEAMDETGYLEDDPTVIASPVVLTQEDIRAVQLAKSAICAGIRTLTHTAELPLDALNKLVIAGGFGSYLSIPSAIRIGLIPHELRGKIRVIGNAALSGAAMLLLSKHLQPVAEALAKDANIVMLSANPIFAEAYMEGMLFETE